MERLVRGFWGPRKESEAEVAARWTALLRRLHGLAPDVFQTWRAVQGSTTFVPPFDTEAVTQCLSEDAARSDWSDRTGYRLALSGSAGQSIEVGIGGSAGGLSQFVLMDLVLTVGVPEADGPLDARLPYGELLRAIAEVWDVDFGDVTDAGVMDALEEGDFGPADPTVGWFGHLSERRAAALSASGQSLPGSRHTIEHDGILLDFAGVSGTEELVRINRLLTAAGALAALPTPMDRAKL